MKYEEISKMVIGCSFEVINELGVGFLESVYEHALFLTLKEKGLSVKKQFPIKVMFRDHCVGEYYSDLLIEDKVIVELKAIKKLLPEHQAQIINYLKATGIEVGLLINFGNSRLEYRRLSLKELTNPAHPVYPC
ncbi:MAG: GxxExxY protein [Spirochaetes bacterium]|nr:MAG: GxxExxY protein [Spirochaetota bacterium]